MRGGFFVGLAGVMLASVTVAVAQPAGPPVAIVEERRWTLDFDFDASVLNAGAQGEVADIAAFFKAALPSDYPVKRFIIVGYADTAGPYAYNVALSKRRAHAVADALVAAGVPHDLIAVDWKGETSLAVATGDRVAEARNRRGTVDVVF